MLAVQLLPQQVYILLRSRRPMQDLCKPLLVMVVPQENMPKCPRVSTRVITTSPSFQEKLAKMAQSIRAPKQVSTVTCNTALPASSNSQSCHPARIVHSSLQVAVLQQETKSWSTRSKDSSPAVGSQIFRGRSPRLIKALTCTTRSTPQV